MERFFSGYNHNPTDLNKCISNFLQAEAIFDNIQKEVCVFLYVLMILFLNIINV